jgi:hypothetical protein
MVYARNTDSGNSKTFQAAQEHTAKGITDGLAEARFQGLEFKSALKIICFLHRDFVRLLEVQNTAHMSI